MPINAHPEFLAAEKEYLLAQKPQDKIEKLKKMISLAPSHKGAENLRAELKTRLKKLTEKLEKAKGKRSRGSRPGIKKEDLQAVIIGKANSGKSSLLAQLTKAQTKISESVFTTTYPIVGMMSYNGVNIQIIDMPAIESEYYDKGVAHMADLVIILAENLNDIEFVRESLGKIEGKIIIALGKSDRLDKTERRKIAATLQSRKYDFVMLSSKTGEGIEDIKQKMFENFGKIRVFTKEPGKKRSDRPVILKSNSSVREIALKILGSFSKNIVETKIWGPSSKFPGQKVGLAHILKDLDTVEFKTR